MKWNENNIKKTKKLKWKKKNYEDWAKFNIFEKSIIIIIIIITITKNKILKWIASK